MGALVSVATMEAASPAFADVSDAERARRILAASASVEAYVGRPLLQATFTETHRPENSRMIYLRVTPVSSVTSIIYGPSGSQTTITDYTVDEETGALELYQGLSSGFRFPDRTYGADPRSGTVTVEYVGGYALADVPADIADAVIHAVLARGATVGLSGGGMYASEQLGEYSYRRASSSVDGSGASAGLPDTATGPLRKYRRIRFS